MYEGTVWRGQSSLVRVIGWLSSQMKRQHLRGERGKRDKQLGKCPSKSYATLID